MWPTLIQSLVQNVTNENSTEAVKESTLEAIGYICQDIEQRCLEESSNHILTAIVHGMKREEPSDHVRLAATNALLNSLEFTKANFEKEVTIRYNTCNRARLWEILQDFTTSLAYYFLIDRTPFYHASCMRSYTSD